MTTPHCGEIACVGPRSTTDDTRLAALVQATITGDARAWQALWLAVEPMVWAITGRWRLVSRLSKSEEDRRNIVVRVMGQLYEDDFRRLRLFRESFLRRGEGSFRSWLATVAARSAISYLRTHPMYIERPGPTIRWRAEPLVPTSVEIHGVHGDPTLVLEGRNLLERAHHLLRADQLRALVLWLHGWTHDEIAAELELDEARVADKLVRSGLKRLRDRYARASHPQAS